MELDAIRENVFPQARGAVEDWSRFPWNLHAASRRSSQVLALDVFGTIATRPAVERDAVLTAVAAKTGVQSSGPWTIHLEWSDPDNGLNEVTTTKVDATAISPDAILLFECKFTEGGGGCSQVRSSRGRPAACDGSYRVQTNPNSGKETRCALAGKGIRYWDHVGEVYGLDVTSDLGACPFAFDAFQWMRNVVLAKSLRLTTGKQVRACVAYAEAPHLATSAKLGRGGLGVRTARLDDALVPISYQQIIQIAGEVSTGDCWSELNGWVESKIEASKPKKRPLQEISVGVGR